MTVRGDPTALIASARQLTTTNAVPPPNEKWSRDAWEYYETTPEFSFGVNWKASLVSKARLIAARRPQQLGDEPTPITEGLAVDLVSMIDDSADGMAGLLEGFSVSLDVPGIAFTVAGLNDTEVDWRVFSDEEVRVKAKRYQVQVGSSEKDWLTVPDDALMIQVWRPDKRRHSRPWSPAKPLLGTLRELQNINNHIEATLISRLAGAGIIFTPKEMVFPSKGENSDAEDPFADELMEAMTTPIKDRASAAAYVPIHVEGPGEHLDKITHMTFWSDVSAQILEMRESAIRRLATGLDVPAEVILGMADANHWTGWLIDEQATKVAVEPALRRIAAGLSYSYLIPMLTAAGEFQGDEIVWFDISEIVTRPDRSDQATAAHTALAISTPAYLNEVGLDESAIPTTAQLREQAWKKLLDSVTMAPAAMVALGLATADEFAVAAEIAGRDTEQIDILDDPDAPAVEPGPPVEGEPAPDSPEPDVPATVAAAGYSLVHRALERAGNRILNRRRSRSTDPAVAPEDAHLTASAAARADLDGLLDGAWTVVPVVAAASGVDPAWFESSLDSYARWLIENGEPLGLVTLTEFLTPAAS